MDISNCTLKSVSIHFVGNKISNQRIILSPAPLALDEELSIKLKDFFLHGFTESPERFRFTHQSSLRYNEVYNYINNLFLDQSIFHELSKDIATHLFEKSNHPQIKSGEVYVCFFENCLIGGKSVDAIGVFKTENKKPFWEINNNNNEFTIRYKEGIDLAKLDKGCLVFNADENNGFIVCNIDNQNKGSDTQYWRENFLGLEPISNAYYQTKEFLNLTKKFVVEQLSEEIEISKTDQIDLLNRSVDYFKKHSFFEKDNFEKEVFQNKDLIDFFQRFDKTYCDDNEISLTDNFEISTQAVKKQTRIFKSVLKLDKNFHIYIHGNRDLIEQGVDKNGRKFYKIYYEEEN